jgi:hypothetical protein
MHSVILLELRTLLRFPHEHHDRTRTSKHRVAAPLISLPCCDEMAKSLLKELFIDLDLCHDEFREGGDGRDSMLGEIWKKNEERDEETRCALLAPEIVD